ncbi:MAG: Periplasmic zinc-binding protein TroA precursor [Planctomycetota bacterium]
MIVRRRRVLGWGAIYAGGLTVASVGCSNTPTADAPDVTRSGSQVVSTVSMIGDLVQRIGDSRINCVTLMGSGVDPHLYKATADDFRSLCSADLVFSVGLMLEGRLQESLRKLGNKQQVVMLAEQLPKERLLNSEPSDTATTPAHPDPHVWLDIDLWSGVIPAITSALSGKLPQFSSEFQSRAAALAEELRQLHEYGKQVISTIPEPSRVLVTSHDAFQYFGRAYGLKVLGVQGISTESEAGLLRVNQLVDLIVERRVAAVFVETSVPRKSIEALIEGSAARGHRVRIGGSLFSDAMGPDGTWEGTYPGMLDHNLTTVALALGGSAPPRGFKEKLASSREHSV